MALRANEYRIGITRRQEYIALSWTTETPTAEGWYWLNDWGVVRVALEKYPNGNEELVVYTAEAGRGNEEPESVIFYHKLGCHWLGPLPVPDTPKE